MLLHPEPELARQISRWHFQMRRVADRLRALSDSLTSIEARRIAKGTEVSALSGSRICVANTLMPRLVGTALAVPDDDNGATMVVKPSQ